MLRFFEQQGTCHILFEAPIDAASVEQLKSIFERGHESFYLDFGTLDTICFKTVSVLEKALFQEGRSVRLVTHRIQLQRYLKKLGFEVEFVSIVGANPKKVSNIEVVIISGSADSSDKIIKIVESIVSDTIAVVIVQHQQENGVMLFDTILQRVSSLKVLYARQGEPILKGCIYFAPPSYHLLVEDGCFVLSSAHRYTFLQSSIPLAYDSFANYYKEKLVIIQECDYLDDGVDILESVQKMGTTIIVQHPAECIADAMPKSVLKRELEEYALKVDEIILYLEIVAMQREPSDWLFFLLEQIYKRYGYELFYYKHEMIARRLKLFMLKNGIESIKDIVAPILFQKALFLSFLLEISITVTEFFREPQSLKVLMQVFHKSKKYSSQVKVWSAGCSSGEEAYSLAILFDAIGLLQKTLLYATDFNKIVLQEAKNGIYGRKSYEQALGNFQQIGLDLRWDDYIEKSERYFFIKKDIKRHLHFFEHNLISDGSFNEFDVIVCRNVIIYFSETLQERVIGLFYGSLRFGGYLLLGDKEEIASRYVDKFQRVDATRKLFKKVA